MRAGLCPSLTACRTAVASGNAGNGPVRFPGCCHTKSATPLPASHFLFRDLPSRILFLFLTVVDMIAFRWFQRFVEIGHFCLYKQVVPAD